MWKRNGLFIIVIVMYLPCSEGRVDKFLINFYTGILAAPKHHHVSINYLFILCARHNVASVLTMTSSVYRRQTFIISKMKMYQNGMKSSFQINLYTVAGCCSVDFCQFLCKLFALSDRILADCRHFYNDFLLQFISHFSRTAWNVCVSRGIVRGDCRKPHIKPINRNNKSISNKVVA